MGMNLRLCFFRYTAQNFIDSNPSAAKVKQVDTVFNGISEGFLNLCIGGIVDVSKPQSDLTD